MAQVDAVDVLTGVLAQQVGIYLVSVGIDLRKEDGRRYCLLLLAAFCLFLGHSLNPCLCRAALFLGFGFYWFIDGHTDQHDQQQI